MRRFRVKCEVRNRLVANFPENVDALKYVVMREKKKEKLTDEQADKLKEELTADLLETHAVSEPEPEESTKCIFLKDENGLYLRARNIKGWLKEVYKTIGVRGYREAINHGVFVVPDKIYLKRDGGIIKKADGEVTNPIQVISPRGRRSSVKVAEFVQAPCEFEFELKVADSIASKLFTKKMLREIEELGGEIGFLGDRSLQEGQCNVKIEEVI